MVVGGNTPRLLIRRISSSVSGRRPRTKRMKSDLSSSVRNHLWISSSPWFANERSMASASSFEAISSGLGRGPRGWITSGAYSHAVVCNAELPGWKAAKIEYLHRFAQCFLTKLREGPVLFSVGSLVPKQHQITHYLEKPQRGVARSLAHVGPYELFAYDQIATIPKAVAR